MIDCNELCKRLDFSTGRLVSILINYPYSENQLKDFDEARDCIRAILDVTGLAPGRSYSPWLKNEVPKNLKDYLKANDFIGLLFERNGSITYESLKVMDEFLRDRIEDAPGCFDPQDFYGALDFNTGSLVVNLLAYELLEQTAKPLSNAINLIFRIIKTRKLEPGEAYNPWIDSVSPQLDLARKSSDLCSKLFEPDGRVSYDSLLEVWHEINCHRQTLEDL